MKKLSNLFIYVGFIIIASGFIYEIFNSPPGGETTGISFLVGPISAPFFAVGLVLKIIIDRKNKKAVTYSPLPQNVAMKHRILTILFFVLIIPIIIFWAYNTLGL